MYSYRNISFHERQKYISTEWTIGISNREGKSNVVGLLKILGMLTVIIHGKYVNND